MFVLFLLSFAATVPLIIGDKLHGTVTDIL